MRMSVVVPSRCDVDPRSAYGDVYLEKALQSIRQQTLKVHEICIGVQRRDSSLDRLVRHYPDWEIKICPTDTPGQAAALNAAVAAVTGDVIAFLEDDDFWQPQRLSLGLKALEQYACEFASSNQLEVDLSGQLIKVNDFATPSGWLMSSNLWHRTGGFDESLRWHMDTDFLGKLLKLQVERVHLVERGAKIEERQWLGNAPRFTRVVWTSEPLPLVTRLQNPRGGMSIIAGNASAKAQSNIEHQLIRERYGINPW